MPRKPKPKTKHTLMIDALHVRASDICKLFAQSTKMPRRWQDAGCPRNDDLTFDLIAVLKWRETKQSEASPEKGDLEKQKLQLQNEKLGIEINKLKSENIPIETHNSILCSRASSFKCYWTDIFKRNLHLFAHKSIDQLRPVADKVITESINHYSREHK